MKTAAVAIIGATGYTGQELIRLLLQRDDVKIHAATSQSYKGERFASVYPNALGLSDLVCSEANLEALAHDVDVMFLALPHGHAAAQINQNTLKQCVVIDLGADFRLKRKEDYGEWYEFVHPNPSILADAVYGLTELNRKNVSKARLIANPGCYATCSILIR